MHFRIRKNVVQFIRTTYDSSKKKGVNTIVGTVALASPELSDDLRKQLSNEEISAFNTWLNTQHRALLLKEEFAALNLAETIALAEKWFERNNDTKTSQLLVTEIVNNWLSLRRILSQKGLLD